MSFTDLGLAEGIVRAVTENGYTNPTPIQAQAIPAVLAGGDLLAGAQTGTCLLYTSPSPRDKRQSRMPSSA